MHKLTNGIF